MAWSRIRSGASSGFGSETQQSSEVSPDFVAAQNEHVVNPGDSGCRFDRRLEHELLVTLNVLVGRDQLDVAEAVDVMLEVFD